MGNERVQLLIQVMSFLSTEDKWHWSSNVTPHYLTWRAPLALLTVHCSTAERLSLHHKKKKKNLHPSDLMLPITSNTPRGLSVNIAPPKERGPQTNRLWSELRSVWLTTRSRMVTRPLPLIMLFLKLTSSNRNSSVLYAARGLPPQYFSPLLIFRLAHTHKLQRTETGKKRWVKKRKRD